MSALGRCLCISLTAPLCYQTIMAFLCGLFEQFANRFSGVFKGDPCLSGWWAGSFSEDRPLGWDPVARRAIGRAMEWPDSCPRRKLPAPPPASLSNAVTSSVSALEHFSLRRALRAPASPSGQRRAASRAGTFSAVGSIRSMVRQSSANRSGCFFRFQLRQDNGQNGGFQIASGPGGPPAA